MSNAQKRLKAQLPNVYDKVQQLVMEITGDSTAFCLVMFPTDEAGRLASMSVSNRAAHWIDPMLKAHLECTATADADARRALN